MGVIQRIKKPTTHKGKKFLMKKEPKVIEDCKHTIFIRGRKTNDILMSCVKDLYSLKRPNAVMYGKKNDILPFENAAPVEVFCKKFSASLFAFASANKKRPKSLIFGRTYDSHILDMIELNITNYKSILEFEAEKIMVGLKPCLLFAGEGFDAKPEMIRLKNLFIDFFQREPVTAIRLRGLEHVLMFTAHNDCIYLRSYRIILKECGAESPRVELDEIGPSIDFTLGRTKLGSDDLFKTACKKPKELKVGKKKNVSTNVFGTKEARVHVSKQNISSIQIKKMKGLRKSPKAKKGAAAEPKKKLSKKLKK